MIVGSRTLSFYLPDITLKFIRSVFPRVLEVASELLSFLLSDIFWQ